MVWSCGRRQKAAGDGGKGSETKLLPAQFKSQTEAGGENARGRE